VTTTPVLQVRIGALGARERGPRAEGALASGAKRKLVTNPVAMGVRRDVLPDVLRIPAGAEDQHRAERVLERESREVQSRSRLDDAALVLGQPSSSITGRSIQLKSCVKPVHQITFATSRTVPSSSSGLPSRTPATRAVVRSMPAA
jgi:hypothetical protein